MFDSIAIPGILLTWPVAGTNNEIPLRSANTNGTFAVVQQAIMVLLLLPQEENERPKAAKERMPA